MNRSVVLVILIPLQTFRSWPLISGVPSTLESLQDLHTPRNRFFFSFICLRLVLLASNIKVYRIAMSVISSHSLSSRQILLWPPFKEIENNNCFKIYTARSDLKKSERKPLKHDYLEFLIDRSINGKRLCCRKQEAGMCKS